MQIIPAIDLIKGNCVRLKQGVQGTQKIYSSDPAAQALTWQNSGASLLHVVNLDGAFGQAEANAHAITAILRHTAIPIELGGGIRSVQDAERWLNLGVARVIFGTVAVTHPKVIKEAVQAFGAERVVVGVDAKDDTVAIKGWVEQSQKTLLPFVHDLEQLGVSRIIYTDVSCDGESHGPNLGKLDILADVCSLNIVASGGFSKLEHFDQLCQLGRSQIEAAIVGTALYEGELDLSVLIERYERKGPC